MRICIVSSQFAGLTAESGTGSLMRGFCDALRGTGDELTVLVTDPATQSNNLRMERTYGNNVQFFFLSSVASTDSEIFLPTTPASISYAVYRYVKVNDFDVLHFHESGGIGFYAALARRQGGLRALVVTHLNGGSRWRRSISLEPPSLADLEEEALECVQIENSDFILSPSQYSLGLLDKEKISIQRHKFIPRVLPEWIEAKEIPCNVLSTPEVAPGQVSEIIFLGHHSRLKGLELLVESIRLFPHDLQPDLTFLGRFGRIGPEFSGAYVMRALSNYKGRIRFIDDMSSSQALAWAKNKGGRSLCVMPSIGANSPCAIVECFTAGLPFLATDVGGTSELIEAASRAHCLVDPGANQLCDAIRRVMTEGLPTIQSTLRPKDIIDRVRAWHKSLLPSPVKQSGIVPLVSICLVHYERPRLLRRALDHLMRQTYENLEIILVDDGSRQKDSLDYLDEIENGPFRFPLTLIRSENRYLGAARNLAASRAKGKYLLFHDDDNFSEPEEVEVFVRAAENTAADVLTCQFKVSREDDDTSAHGDRRIETYPIGIGGVFSYFENRFGDANALVLRDKFEELGGFSELRDVGWEDWEFFLRAHIRGLKIRVVPEPLFNYRVSDAGMRNSTSLLQNEERIYAAIRRENPRFDIELLRFAKAQQLEALRLAELDKIFRRIVGGDIHRELLSIDPASPKAKCKLADLMTQIGREPAVLAASARGTSPHHGVGHTVKGEWTVKAGGPSFLMVEGWAFVPRARPYVPRILSIDGCFFRAVAHSTRARPDVAERFGLRGFGDPGFELLVQEIKRPPLALRGREIEFFGPERIRLYDRNLRKILGHVDQITRYKQLSLLPPTTEWTGILTVRTDRARPIFLSDQNGGFDRCEQSYYACTQIVFRQSVSRLRLLVPSNDEIKLVFESFM